MPEIKRVLLTGATGFIGVHVYPALQKAGLQVVCGSRNPEQAQKRFPGRAFVKLDISDYDSVVRAMEGCDAALYLVHSMADVRRYEKAEEREAKNFVRAAEQAQLKRIVYLGGVMPKRKPSRHLRSRARTGEVLRSGRVSTVELQAAMVIGPGGESWRMVRDLAARLPVMLLPRWLSSRSQPIFIDDVTTALTLALTLEQEGSAVYPLPGPDTLSARDILTRTAELMGLSPRMMGLPVITPRLSSYWIALVTRANQKIARQLVEGLRTDLIAADAGFWKLFPQHERVSFDEAARRALLTEAETLSLRGRFTEWLIHRLTPASPSRAPATPEPTRDAVS
ncbi:MAG: NAD(P)H-binding protein [Polyangiales bacterium]